MASIWLVLAIILGLAYLLLMASILVGWFKINKEVITSEIADKKAEIKVSVLIAFRNEAPHLPNILEDLIQQNYPVGLSEFILINDHSSDKGPAIIEKCQQQHSAIRLLNSPPDEKGKKKALRYGLSFSQGEIILFTDADCRLSPDWISTMVQSFSDPSCILCQGPVMISPAKTLLAKLQQIEFLSLMMSAAGSIGIRQGILVSGANLAVSKKFYQKVSLELKDHINTGDDMFLLEQAKKEQNSNIYYCRQSGAIVSTPPMQKGIKLWNQRKRWSSKSINYQDNGILFSAFLVLLLNLLILLSLLAAIFNVIPPHFPVILWIFKAAVEFPIIMAGCNFYRIPRAVFSFPLAQLIYPFYVVFVAFNGVFGSFNWKDRKR